MKVDCTKDNNFHHWKKARRCMIGYGVEVVMAGVVSAGGSSGKGRRPLGAPRGTSSSSSPRSCSFPVGGGGGLPSRASMRPSLLGLFLLTALALASAEQVVLLDTTTESSLEWTRYPFGPNSPTPGWVEESFTQFENGINWRSYVVCDVAYNNVNNWLWTPFIERGPANRMYIEVKFSMRDCSLFPGTALSCKETFSLLYYEFDAATKEPPFWEPESYKLIDRIAADEGRFTNSADIIINAEVRSIPVTKKGIYFAFRDQGACISLLAIKVYYITCPEITKSFAHFPTTPTGAEVTSIEQAKGVCVAHAREDPPAKFLCTGDGQWSLLSGGCACLPGYQGNVEKQSCDVCPPGKFKDAVGASACRACPDHSAAPHAGATECRCDTGYYRAHKDPRSMPCTRPPSKPQNVTANVLDQSTVILGWQPPVNDGGRTDILYRVICDACSNQVSYNPPQVAEESFNTTQVTITGLYPVTTYRFQVFAENGVSDQGRDPQYVDITVTTEASVPAMVSNVHVTSVKSTEISLAWDAPNDPDNEIEMYEVRYFVRGMESNSSSLLATKEESSVGALRQRTEYGFQVRAKTANGFGDYSPPIYKMTGQLLSPAYVGDEDNTQVRIIVGATVGACVVIAVIVIMTLLFLRRGTDECNKKQPSDCDTLEYRNGEDTTNLCLPALHPACFRTGHLTPWTLNTSPLYMHGVLENPPIVQTHITGSMTTPLFTQVGHHRTYIDPHTYEDPNQAIREFAREIDASYITIEAIIGGGEFGDVCKGKLQLPSRPEMTVAIKTLKPGSSEKARVDFLTEASIMGQFEHPNVIFLQGVVTKSNPVMIITEYMENGSLDHFLRVNDGKFQVLQLVGMLRCIASGMQYLSEMNYVHRDLAARNVLVNAQLICKIADFGLSREIESHTEGAYTTRGGKIPVRWTAPEAIAFRKFTSASDVWSLGIVMWEVMSYGERPYWNWSNQDVIKSIEKGYRLPAPMECPEAIYQLMLDCWQKERNHRPNFASIVRTLDRLIRTPEALNKVAQNRCTTALGLDSVDMTQLTSVEDWLASIKMTRYLDNFQRTGLTDLEAVARLTQHDLTQLGITLVGHQKKILQSIHTMRTQLAVNMSEGFLV
ncbi:ephrin type-B receptor 1-like isoform X4 [Penaeus japonicus]|uniref:ephrin type-B receptor 1-like isoform X4 n=1 Tax=Penaeus japonicus TaxID=27405 RepID=UPI001C71279F|nr:ephrin type-B receptor 1-like isoform X4 [Penaeus japonicus]